MNRPSVDESVLSREKQFELMFTDTVNTIADRKRTIFDLSRWIVTLQGLVVGFVAVRGESLAMIFVVVPVMIGLLGLVLNGALSAELAQHRRSLAVIRDKVGGEFAGVYEDFMRSYLKQNETVGPNYWRRISSTHQVIILVATAVATISVLSI